MGYLTVPGADLYYETVGSGPLLLTVSGANGTADLWHTFASHLSSQFTICMYDRRGFSRSFLTGAQDYALRLETDADDAAALINSLSPNTPATVLGNSSGAIVTLMLLTRHPDIVATAIAHEPPCYPLLPPGLRETVMAYPKEVYSIYRAHGPMPAFARFAEMGKLDSPEEQAVLMKAMGPGRNPYNAGNLAYWFERELCVYPLYEFDVEVLRKLQSKLVLANGKSSVQDAPQVLCNVQLAEKLGLQLEQWHGMHMGFAGYPEEFAKDFQEFMGRRKGS